MAKQNPYRFSLGFDEEDPDHQEVARILNQLGHRKAKFVVKAVLAYHQKHRREIFKRAGGDRQEAGYTKRKTESYNYKMNFFQHCKRRIFS